MQRGSTALVLLFLLILPAETARSGAAPARVGPLAFFHRSEEGDKGVLSRKEAAFARQ